MADDRDRVTAIREIAEPLNDLEIVWMADRLLEALDTIDRLEAENAELKKRRYWTQYVEPKEGDGVDW